MRHLLGLCLVFYLLGPAFGDDEADGWRDKLPPEIVSRLDRDGLVVIDHPLKQIFQPYIGSSLPVFVTSDTVLNAYHLLFEESVIRLERERARRLPGFLLRTWAGLVKPGAAIRLEAKTVEDARRRARVTIATAIVLLGAEVPDGDGEARKLAVAEAARIEAASFEGKPAWLGPPDPGFLGLDYARFRPRGFYDREDDLRRYFRAVAWLQAIPFRVDRDDEFLAAVLLRGAVDFEKDGALLRGYVELLGAGDDLSLFDVSGPDHHAIDRDRLANLRKWSGEHDSFEINDLVAVSKDSRGRSVRILPSARTPESVLFSRTAGGPPPGRCMPVGLEVTAALGHAWSRAGLTDLAGEEVVKKVDAARTDFGADGLYARYLRTVATLLDPPEPDAPAIFRGDAWQAKAAQTALAGWALLRHTWGLQAKISAAYGGLAETAPGFVEPDPEFFGLMRELVRRTRDLLETGGAFDVAVVRRDAGAAIGVLLRVFDRHASEFGKEWDFWKIHETLGEADRRAVLLAANLALCRELPDVRHLDAKKADRLRAGLEEARAILADPAASLPADLRRMIRRSTERLTGPWRDLETICGRLETLAHKQLRGVAFRESERRFLKDFGETLAAIMLHDGNSYLEPKDDTPRITTVHRDPNTDRWLQVGVARPRPILVLYPTKDGPVLCSGAVMAYREFAWSGPMTDAEWKALLDAKKAPDGPAWRKAIEVPPPPPPAEEK
jgi:Protein of unknown function (DUF3160)